MAVFAELRLRHLEQVRLTLEFVNTVTAQAVYARHAMRRALEIRMRRRMTGKAPDIDLRRGHFCEAEDHLGGIAAAVNVCLARAVAALAGNPLAAVHQCKTGMRIGGKVRGLIRVAGRAGIGADVIGGVVCTLLSKRGSRLPVFAGSAHHPSFPEAREQRNHRYG